MKKLVIALACALALATVSLPAFASPARTDFISLAERLTQIEMRLDDLDAKLDELMTRLPKPSPHAPKRKKAT